MKPHEAWAAFEALTLDELAQLLTVEWKGPTILKRDGAITCRALQKAVSFEMHKVGHYMRILHGLAQTDTAATPEPERPSPEAAAPAVVKLTADMRKLADEIDAVSQESITTRVHEATERAQSAYEAQIRAAETKIASMSAELDDLEYTNIEMISYAYALDKRVAALTAENDRVRTEHDEARAEIAAMTTAQTVAEQQHTSLRTEIADVRGANQTLVTTLAEARQERDAYRQQRDEHKETASLVPDLRIDLAKCKVQLEVGTAEMQQYRSSSIRMRDEHARELAQLKREHKLAQDDAHETIIELRQLLAALAKRPVDA